VLPLKFTVTTLLARGITFAGLAWRRALSARRSRPPVRLGRVPAPSADSAQRLCSARNMSPSRDALLTSQYLLGFLETLCKVLLDLMYLFELRCFPDLKISSDTKHFLRQKNIYIKNGLLRIFQRFRLVKFIEKFKTGVKNLKIEKIIAFDKYLHELFFAIYVHLGKTLFPTLKNNKVADLTHFSTKCGCF